MLCKLPNHKGLRLLPVPQSQRSCRKPPLQLFGSVSSSSFATHLDRKLPPPPEPALPSGNLAEFVHAVKKQGIVLWRNRRSLYSAVCMELQNQCRQFSSETNSHTFTSAPFAVKSCKVGSSERAAFLPNYETSNYCWWKKSCTSWYGKYPIIYKVLYARWCRISSINSITQSQRKIKFETNLPPHQPSVKFDLCSIVKTLVFTKGTP